MSSKNEATDLELEALMAELEEQNAKALAPAPATPATKLVRHDVKLEVVPVVPEVPPAPVVVQCDQESAGGEVPSAANVPSECRLSTAVVDVVDPLAPSAPDGALTYYKAPPGGFYTAAATAAPVMEAPAPAAPAAPSSQLRHYVDVDQFRNDTRITDGTLDHCMIEQSGLRAYYAAQAAHAEAQAARLRAKFDVVEATLTNHHRKALAAAGEKTTEKMIECAVKIDPRWLKGVSLVIEAETIAQINKGLVESLRDRASMLVQLGADRRGEMKGDLRVMEKGGEDLTGRIRAMQQAMQKAGG